MYTTVIRQYLLNNEIKTYAEHYYGDEESGDLLCAVHLNAEITPLDDSDKRHYLFLELQATCHRLAQELETPLF